MVRTVNEQDFENPGSRRLALGQSLSDKDQLWLDPSGSQAVSLGNGGMIDPVRHEVEPGTLLYRFASVTDTVEGAMRGGWWLERRELNQLIQYARINDRTLGYAVRLLCCVPPEWGSALNFLVGARAATLIAAWGGLANSAAATYAVKPGMSAAAAGTTRIASRNDVAALRVPQLFIPGARRAGAARALFRFEGQWQTEGAIDWIYGSGL